MWTFAGLVTLSRRFCIRSFRSHTGFTVNNLDEVFVLLKRSGVKIDFNITQLNDLGHRAFGFRDIDGNLIQILGK